MRWRFPTLPDSSASFAASLGVSVLADRHAPAPQSRSSFGALFAHARAEQTLRALASRTNFVLPSATAFVVGDGEIAAAIAVALARGGARVMRAIDDPVVRLRAHLEGVRTTSSRALPPVADLLIATGENQAPIDQAVRSGTAIDASVDGSGLLGSASTGTVRAGVRGAGPTSWIVDSPPVFAAESTLSLRIADQLIALSILQASADDADARLAELALA